MNLRKKDFSDSIQANIPEDVQESSKKMGERLAYLISSLFSPDERANILSVIEKLSPEELFDYYENLEKRFQEMAVTADQQLDQNYDQDIQKIKNNHDLKTESIKKNFSDELNSLEEEISKK